MIYSIQNTRTNEILSLRQLYDFLGWSYSSTIFVGFKKQCLTNNGFYLHNMHNHEHEHAQFIGDHLAVELYNDEYENMFDIPSG